MFCEAACALDETPYPIPLWVSFRPEVHEDGTVSFSSHGLLDLGHQEVEIHHARAKPSQVLECVADFAFYIVQNGPIVADGDTFGHSRDEKIRVHHRRKGRWFKEPVYEFEFPSA